MRTVNIYIMGSVFSAFRLKKPTIKRLQKLKLAFELTYSQPLSNDFFMEKMMGLVQEHDTKVWKHFTELLAMTEQDNGESEKED